MIVPYAFFKCLFVWCTYFHVATSSIGTSFSTCPSIVIIQPNGIEAIRIECHGQVTFGEGVNPTEATRLFVDELRKMGMKWECNKKEDK